MSNVSHMRFPFLMLGMLWQELNCFCRSKKPISLFSSIFIIRNVDIDAYVDDDETQILAQNLTPLTCQDPAACSIMVVLEAGRRGL